MSLLRRLNYGCLYALAIAASVSFIPDAAQAAPLCVTAGLDTYIALNESGGCMVGNATLFNFSFTALPPTNLPGPPSAADVTVSPLSGALGLSFTSASLFMLSDDLQPQSATYTVHYTVDPPPIIVGEDLSVDPPVGNLVITQNLCEFDLIRNGCTKGFALSQSVTPLSTSSSLRFPVPTSVLDIDTIFSLNSTPGSPAGFDKLDAATIESTPEPSSFGLLAVAVICLTLGRGLTGKIFRF